jgi:hypothetical protein
MNTAEERLTIIERQISELGTATSRLTDLLTGGNRPADGLIVMVDRLGQAEEARRYWSRWAVGIASTALVTAVLALMGEIFLRTIAR